MHTSQTDDPVTAINVRALEPQDKNAAQALADESLGAGYFAAAARDMGESLWLGAFQSQALVGVARAVIVPFSSLGLELNLSAAIGLPGESQVGLLKTLAVAPGARKQGIGAQLTQARLQWLSLRRVSTALAVSWQGAGPAAAALLQACGFRAVARLEAPYADESLAHGVACPVCGAPPCACPGTLFWRSLGAIF